MHTRQLSVAYLTTLDPLQSPKSILFRRQGRETARKEMFIILASKVVSTTEKS